MPGQRRKRDARAGRGLVLGHRSEAFVSCSLRGRLFAMKSVLDTAAAGAATVGTVASTSCDSSICLHRHCQPSPMSLVAATPGSKTDRKQG
jgi:hypothetical protein